MTRTVFVIACLSTLFLASNRADVQRRMPGFVNRPVISPYVNLFQSNNGGLNSYFSFVRPRKEVDNFMRQSARQNQLQQALVQQEAVQIQRTIENAFQESELQTRPSNSAAMCRPAGTFMQFSPFFPNNDGTQRRTLR